MPGGSRTPAPRALVLSVWAGALAWVVAVLGSFLLIATGVLNSAWPAEFYSALFLPVIVPVALLAVRAYGLDTRFGQAAGLLGLGGVLWCAGDTIYTLRTSCPFWAPADCVPSSDGIPYPSLADLGYLAGPLCWGLACITLWRAVGIGRRDVVAYAWIPAASVVLVVAVGMPTMLHIGQLPVGGNVVADAGSTTAAVFTALYLACDALILPGAIILWHRSYRFPAFRFAALASALLYLGDILYNVRLAQGTYNPAADVSDFAYALSGAALVATLAALEHAARRERGRQARTMRELTARQAARGAVAGEREA